MIFYFSNMCSCKTTQVHTCVVLRGGTSLHVKPHKCKMWRISMLWVPNFIFESIYFKWIIIHINQGQKSIAHFNFCTCVVLRGGTSLHVKPHKCALFCHLCGFTWSPLCTCVVLRGDSALVWFYLNNTCALVWFCV